MTWLRWAAAVPLIVAFLILLAVLLVAVLTIYVVTWAVYSSVGEPRLRETFDPSEYKGVEAVFVSKGNEIAVDSLDAYASGIGGKALVVATGSAVGLAGVVVWSRRAGYDEEDEPIDSNT